MSGSPSESTSPSAAPDRAGPPRVALVTGAARGNGLAIAEALAARGDTVYLADIAQPLPHIPYPMSSAETLEAAVAQVRRHHGRVQGRVCDVRDEAAVNALVAEIGAAEGRLDILVNNAGVLALNTIEATTTAQWDVQFDVIAKGAFFCCRAAVPLMNARSWGRIVNVASIAGHRGLGTAVAYTAAKHALVGLTRALAMEVARQGITVNAVCPGTVPTPLVRETVRVLGLEAEQGLRQLMARHLGGHPISSEDVAEAVAYLASDAAGRVNGASLFVDDGWHAH